MNHRILLTGGAGYIGTHCAVELLAAGYTVVIIDNLDNGSALAVQRVREISGCDKEQLSLEVVDMVDFEQLDTFFKKYANKPFSACIHLASLKAVGESVKLPLHYYYNNLNSTLNLLHYLDKYNCHNFVFSSSATVYGDPTSIPISETEPIHATNPYGSCKEFIEQICDDVNKAKPKTWSIALLRYFNPIGAHPSGKIGEDPQGYPNNLLPFVAQVAVGRREKLSIFGKDYNTPDGTGVRDYIHVVDLAKGHVAGLEKMLNNPCSGVSIYNLGTGKGVSVLEVVNAFSKESGKLIPYEFVDRRPGDIATCYADPTKAKKELGWEATLGINEMCRDAWNWQKNNPQGYRTEDEVKQRNKGEDSIRKAKVFQIYGK